MYVPSLNPVFSVSAWECSLCAPPGGQLSPVIPKHHRGHCHSTGTFWMEGVEVICLFRDRKQIDTNCDFLFWMKGNCGQAEKFFWQLLVIYPLSPKDSSLPVKKVSSVCVCVHVCEIETNRVEEAIVMGVLCFQPRRRVRGTSLYCCP